MFSGPEQIAVTSGRWDAHDARKRDAIAEWYGGVPCPDVEWSRMGIRHCSAERAERLNDLSLRRILLNHNGVGGDG